jgi:hypothetical protein
VTDNSTVEIKLVRSRFSVRPPCPCIVCGGTEEAPVLAEVPIADAGGGETIRVCERCLEVGTIDEQLAAHAGRLEANAQAVRSLIGRLRVPTFAQWQAACDYEERRCSLWNALDRAEGAGWPVRSRNEMATFLILHAPAMLEHVDRVLAEWLVDAPVCAETRALFNDIPF